MKKKLGKSAVHYRKLGIEPEFVRMSRKPGLGTKWYEQFQGDIYPHGYALIRGGIKTAPPKFYAKKYEISDPDKFAQLKEQRIKEALKRASDNTSSRLRVKEYVKKYVTKTLARKLD